MDQSIEPLRQQDSEGLEERGLNESVDNIFVTHEARVEREAMRCDCLTIPMPCHSNSNAPVTEEEDRAELVERLARIM